jgi:hypothetical protein
MAAGEFFEKAWFMADAPPPKPVRKKPARPGLAARERAQAKASQRKLNAAALRELARAHSEAALQVLAEVATQGASEASRISAAMALLDRGYGKSGTGPAGENGDRATILYQRIEIIDGTPESSDPDRQAPDRQD